jgi:hypothetical protein
LKKLITKKDWWSGSRCRPWAQAPVLQKKKRKCKQREKWKILFLRRGDFSLPEAPKWHLCPLILMGFLLEWVGQNKSTNGKVWTSLYIGLPHLLLLPVTCSLEGHGWKVLTTLAPLTFACGCEFVCLPWPWGVRVALPAVESQQRERDMCL